MRSRRRISHGVQIGGVSKALLAQTILGAQEREVWKTVQQDARNSTPWLMRRLLLKEACRYWVWQQTGTLLFPADVIISGADGNYEIDLPALPGLAAPPSASLQRTEAGGVAVVTPAGAPAETGSSIYTSLGLAQTSNQVG
ncbi:MAG: hypothetical protein AAFN78_15845 [Pseudomonadota bacterium]